MSQPLNVQTRIKDIDNALKQAIETGHSEKSKLFDIEKELTALTKNPEIPEHVRNSLASALKEIKELQKGGEVNVPRLEHVKKQVDHALSATEEGEGGLKVQGGSLE